MGISLEKNEVLLPPFLNDPRQPFSLDELKKNYDPSSALPLFRGDPSARRLPVIQDQPELSGFHEFWEKAVLKNPGAYLISLSGFLYESLHFFALGSCDFRYQWWTVLGVLLCAVILFSICLEAGLYPKNEGKP